MAFDNMTDDFKLPGSSFEEVNKIIAGYATLNKPSSLADVSKATGGVPESTVSRNAGFLVSLGVIESGNKKSPTEIGKRLGDALMHGVEDDTRSFYTELVSENDFMKNIIGAVRIRKGMDDGSLRSHIAYSAGAKKNQYTTTGAGTVIEILKLTGHLREEDGKLVVGSASSTSISRWTGSSLGEGQTTVPVLAKAVQSSRDGLRVSLPSTSGSPFQINIDVKVTCTIADLDGLGAKLRKVVNEFSKDSQELEGENDQPVD